MQKISLTGEIKVVFKREGGRRESMRGEILSETDKEKKKKPRTALGIQQRGH